MASAVVATLAGCAIGGESSATAETSRFDAYSTSTRGERRVAAYGVIDYDHRIGAWTSVDGGLRNDPDMGEDAEPGNQVRVFGDWWYTDWLVDGKTYWIGDDEFGPGHPLEAILPFPSHGVDPKESFERILAASRRLEDPRPAAVRGEAVTRHVLRLDPEVLARLVAPEQRLNLEDPDHRRPLDLHVWSDGDDRTVRLRFEGRSSPVTYEFFDFGVEVDVERPHTVDAGGVAELSRRSAATEEGG